MKTKAKRSYPPNLDCTLIAFRPCGTGYICGGLSELLCATRGVCKFYRRREEK